MGHSTREPAATDNFIRNRKYSVFEQTRDIHKVRESRRFLFAWMNFA